MSNSNNRNFTCDAVYHVYNRIAHQVFFLQEGERNDFIAIAKRVADFTGIKLLSWCIMTNHFHLLIYLPQPYELSDDEVLARFAKMKGVEVCDLAVVDIDRLRKRMFNISEFMKIVEQWFSQDYNQRNEHKGTLWSGKFKSKRVPKDHKDMSHLAAYHHLNPVRAAMCAQVSDYPWSSWYAAQHGDAVAIEGLRFVYEGESWEWIQSYHPKIMNALLEQEKAKRAQEIAIRRLEGYEMPADPLTDEAMIAQEMAQLERSRNASAELKVVESKREARFSHKRNEIKQAMLDVLRSNPKISAPVIAEAFGVPLSTVYQYLRELKKEGVISQAQRGANYELTHTVGRTLFMN